MGEGQVSVRWAKAVCDVLEAQTDVNEVVVRAFRDLEARVQVLEARVQAGAAGRGGES